MLIFLWNGSSAQGAFENIGLMAGPAGMGGAYTAAAQDTSALIWNPAGLAQAWTPEIGISYMDLQGLVGYSFVGAVHPLRNGRTLGAALLNSSDPEGISQERIIIVSGAIRLWKHLHIGMNAKYLTTSVNLEQTPLGKGRGWGADLGIQYAPIPDTLRIGIVLPNLLSNLSYQRLEMPTYNETLLREWRIGAALKVNLHSGSPDKRTGVVLAAVDITNGLPRIGCEYRYFGLAVRLGWRFTEGLTVGFGYQRGNIGLDYGFVTEKFGSQTSLFSVRLFY